MKYGIRFYPLSILLLGLSLLLLRPTGASAAPQLAMPPTQASISAQGGVVRFTFSEPMDTSAIDIAWEGEGIDGDRFTYEWQDEMFGITFPPYMLDCRYEGGLPPGVEVTFTLNPGNSGVMKSQSGEPLPETSGTFTTPGSVQSDALCFGITPEENRSSVVLMKTVHYHQSGSAAPEFDTEEKAKVIGSVHNTAEADVEATSATLVKPDGSTTALAELSTSTGDSGPMTPSFPSQFYLSTTEPPDITVPTFDSEAALSTEFPDGLYAMDIEVSSGGSSRVDLPLQPTDPFPTPEIRNLQGLQGFDTDQPVTIEWGAFQAADDTDAISLVISDADGNVVFSAPDQCAEPPVELPASETALTIPASVFEPNTSYEGELSFYSISHAGEGTISGFSELAASVKTTRFPLGAPASPGESALNFVGIEVLENGDVSVTLSGSLGSDQVTGKVQRSSNLAAWTDVDTLSKVDLENSGGEVSVVDAGAATSASGRQFYRVVVE